LLRKIKPRVLVVEASYPRDFYNQTLDGVSAHNLLKTMHVDVELHMVITPDYLKKAVEKASQEDFNILHLSCHGNDEGIAVGQPDHALAWDEFVGLFQEVCSEVPALVMSTCCGAAEGVSKVFSDYKQRPTFIFGSTKELGYSEYAAAWAILYHRMATDGVSLDTAQLAMEQISSVVDSSFIYRRWSDEKGKYVKWPRSDSEFRVVDINDEEQLADSLARLRR
jgi:hypothetical protein